MSEKVIEELTVGHIDRTPGHRPSRKVAAVGEPVQAKPQSVLRAWWKGRVVGHYHDLNGNYTGISQVEVVDPCGYLNLTTGLVCDVAVGDMRQEEEK